MRVIAGTFRSRPLVAPRGTLTRPSSDRLRETLFNVLASRIEGSHFADLYAGSGAVGIEALSRGAGSVTFLESAPPALVALRRNLGSLGITEVYQLDSRPLPGSLRALAGTEPKWNIVFLDPPWEAAAAYAQTLGTLGAHAHSLLAPGAVVVAEHRRRPAVSLLPRYGALEHYRILEQGDAALSFFRAEEG